jgi:DNA helicase-2/ATP-dependent DNA helicase PcrA
LFSINIRIRSQRKNAKQCVRSLHLVLPQRFFTHGQAAQGDHVYASRTRFIPEQLVYLFERTAWPKAGAAGARTVAQGPKVDIGARMRGM